jgi:hypothetical protein
MFQISITNIVLIIEVYGFGGSDFRGYVSLKDKLSKFS